jgi:CspA family cold shock protein
MEGVIDKKVEGKGFGFIKIEGEEKGLFFHANDLTGITFDDLKAGDKVSFEKADSPKGEKAINVAKI